MILWAVTMVRDELDVLPYTLEHLVSEGVSGIIVADNMSTDGTWEWLSSQGDLHGCELVVLRDREVGFYQSAKMTDLVHRAIGRGAEWVIPFDADELWFSAKGPSLLCSAFDQAPSRADALLATLYNHFPCSADPSPDDEPNPFLRIGHRDPLPSTLPKVAVRARDDIVVAQGNHGAGGDGPFESVDSPLTVAHLPYRSFEQFRRKVINGAAAYKATTLPDDMGLHWRSYGQLLDEGGEAALRRVFDTYFFDPPVNMEPSIPPWCGHSS